MLWMRRRGHYESFLRDEWGLIYQLSTSLCPFLERVGAQILTCCSHACEQQGQKNTVCRDLPPPLQHFQSAFNTQLSVRRVGRKIRAVKAPVLKSTVFANGNSPRTHTPDIVVLPR